MPTAPPTVRPEPTDGVAVIHVGGGSDRPWTLAGWWDGSSWVQAPRQGDRAATSVPTPSVAAVAVASVDLPGGVVAGLGYAPTSDYVCVDDRIGPFIELGVDLAEPRFGHGYTAVAVSGDWPLQPRPVRAVGLESDVYQALGESLVGAGPGVVPGNGDVAQVLRADLDGDGVEEVLVTFEHITEPGFGAEGDFSLVAARYPTTAGTVVDEVLFEYLVPDPVDFPSPGRASVAAVADLNGDAVMEVVVRSSFWESAFAEIYALEDGRLTPVLAAGCGL